VQRLLASFGVCLVLLVQLRRPVVTEFCAVLVII
jgi:hypothetical protein